MTKQEKEEIEFMEYLFDNPREYLCDDVAHEFLDTYFEEQNEECAFDEYHCKGCSHYSDCRYNEDCAESEWKMQQQFIKGGNKWIDTGATYEEIIDGDVPF